MGLAQYSRDGNGCTGDEGEAPDWSRVTCWDSCRICDCIISNRRDSVALDSGGGLGSVERVLEDGLGELSGGVGSPVAGVWKSVRLVSFWSGSESADIFCNRMARCDCSAGGERTRGHWQAEKGEN